MADSAFEWKEEYLQTLEQIASSDYVEIEWDLLRDILKHKISQNVVDYLANTRAPTPPVVNYKEEQTPGGGLRLAPFPPRETHRLGVNNPPVNYMTSEQAEDLKKMIYDQIDDFDVNPPFTIQRVCELCLQPQKYYKSVGKYLRAVEKSLLVTSTWDSFPISPNEEAGPSSQPTISVGSTVPSTPTTPLFSPIPFLHDDARRSKSRSPPPSPLSLGTVGPLTSDTIDALEPRALGMVDELDDPGPGHMSEHPTPLSSVTTVTEDPSKAAHGLEQRFMTAKEGDEQEQGASQAEDTAMDVDENKENTNTT